MRAILIDPVEQTVTEIDVDAGLSAVKAVLQCRFIDIRGVGCAPDRSPVDIVCDDEGRLVDGQRCFRLGGPDGLLIAGRALLMSHDEVGATTACALPLWRAHGAVEFLAEDFDYEPPAPMIIGFKSFEMLQFLMPPPVGR